MRTLQEQYVHIFTDFGFKRLFGEEPNKDLVLDFFNELLREQEGEIKEVTFLKNEHQWAADNDRRAIIDLYCENIRGEKFIVELQKSKHDFFKNVAGYYPTFPILKQSDWQYRFREIKAVYTVAILDFIFKEDKAEYDKYRYDVIPTDIDTLSFFHKKLNFIYLEMPKFNKGIDELASRFDKWLYILKNLNQPDNIPDQLRDQNFERLFEVADLDRFSREEMLSYEYSLKYYRDLKNVIDTAFEEGKKKGRALAQ